MQNLVGWKNSFEVQSHRAKNRHVYWKCNREERNRMMTRREKCYYKCVYNIYISRQQAILFYYQRSRRSSIIDKQTNKIYRVILLLVI